MALSGLEAAQADGMCRWRLPLDHRAGPLLKSRVKVGCEAKGFGRNYRLYEIQNGNHLGSLKGATVGG